MKKIALFLLLLSGGFILAQSPEKEDYLALDFSKQAIDLTRFPYLLDEVIDATGTENAPVGTGHKGLLNRPVEMTIKHGIGIAFSDLCLRNHSDQALPPAKLRITALTVNEFVGASSETRKVEMEAELALPTKDGFLVYGPLRYVDVSGGIDVTEGHPKAVVRALEDILRRFPAKVAEGQGRSLAAAALHLAPRQFPITEQPLSALPDGFYQTFMDFRAGVVSHPYRPEVRKEFTPYRSADGEEHAILAFRRPEELQGREFNEFWGAQLDGKAYLKIRDAYYQVLRNEESELIVALPEALFLQAGSGTIAAASAMFGLLGGLVAMAATEEERKDLALYRFDPRNGQVTALVAPPSRESVAGLIISNSSFSNKDVTLKVRNAEGTPKILQPGEYILLGQAQEICLSFDGGEETCETVSLSTTAHTLYRLTVKKAAKYRLEWMPDAEAEKVARQLENNELKAVR